MPKVKCQTIFPPDVLSRLRAALTGEMTLQQRLDIIVSKVAALLGVPSCSCYLLRPGDVLELYAAKGIGKRAVHETYLRLGEGLAGEIALQRKNLNYKDVWQHSSFVHKPLTGEGKYKSLAGVPIIRGKNLLGVLIVQTKEAVLLCPEKMDALENVAWFIAEEVLGGQMKSPERKLITSQINKRLDGVRLIDGIAVGRALIHKRMDNVLPVLAQDAQTEIKKLNLALKNIEKEINRILTNPRVREDQAAIFETYLMFLRDKGWYAKMVREIESGLTAPASVKKVEEEMEERMNLISDPYIRERIHDFKDLTNRVIRHLMGKSVLMGGPKLSKNTILVAQSLGPAELLDYDISKIKGIVLEEGSKTIHVVIVARSLNIPVIGGIKNVCELINPTDVIAMDATKAQVYVNPSDELLDEFTDKLQLHRRLQIRYEKMKDLPAVTTDGVLVSLKINAGLSDDLLLPKNAVFDGIGLYRTELPFMSAQELPSTKQQTIIYKKALLQMHGKPVVFRTLDIGSDKVLPYFQNRTEENPAMGWRSIRMTLDRRILLREQLRSFLQATAGRDLWVMFPMIATLDEFLEAKKTFEIELEREKEKGKKLPKSIHIGTMLEVPSLIFQLDALLKHVDFISIGTNDLSQFLFASDRGNPMIWDRYDLLSPSFLNTLKYVVEKCNNAHIPCSVCGEMAGNPLEAMALVGLGFTSLSMNPASIGAVKAMIRTLDKTALENYLKTQLSLSKSLRENLKSWARDHDVLIG